MQLSLPTHITHTLTGIELTGFAHSSGKQTGHRSSMFHIADLLLFRQCFVLFLFIVNIVFPFYSEIITLGHIHRE